MRQKYKYGIDFGTTNSSIACVMDGGNRNKTVKAFAVNGNKTALNLFVQLSLSRMGRL